MNRAFKVIQGHPYWYRQESSTACCRNVQLMPTLFLKLTKIWQRENDKFVKCDNEQILLSNIKWWTVSCIWEPNTSSIRIISMKYILIFTSTKSAATSYVVWVGCSYLMEEASKRTTSPETCDNKLECTIDQELTDVAAYTCCRRFVSCYITSHHESLTRPK